MGDTAMAVPVKVRSHELDQVNNMVTSVTDGLEQAELTEAADEVYRIYDEHISGVEKTYPESPQFAAYLSMPAEDWRMLVRYLNHARTDDNLRVGWLQNKLVSRLEDRLAEMDN